MTAMPAPGRLIADTEMVEAVLRRRMENMPFDLTAMTMVANIHRAATAFRNRVEQDLLSRYDLSWSGFTALYVLWIWGPTEANQLAVDVGVSPPTVTGLLSTLSERGLVHRNKPEYDRRRWVISLTDVGLETVEKVFPLFHSYEVAATTGIPQELQLKVADVLRQVRVATGDMGSPRG